MPTNIEIKARTKNASEIRKILQKRNSDYKGIDHQIDTYFNVKSGRLKLREGNIENALIFYKRNDKAGPKKSEVILHKPKKESNLKEILSASLGIFAIVDKKREIYFIDNVKFHIDNVKSLGTFIEIEAIDHSGKREEEELLEQCKSYMELFDIKDDDLVKFSYSDLIMMEK